MILRLESSVHSAVGSQNCTDFMWRVSLEGDTEATPLVLSEVSGEVTPCNYPETSVNMQQHRPPAGLAKQLRVDML